MLESENKVKCKCGEFFEFNPLQKNRGVLYITYTECPKCLHRYFALITDPTIRKRLDKTQLLRKRLEKESLNIASRKKLQSRFKNYVHKNRELMNKLAEENRELVNEVLHG